MPYRHTDPHIDYSIFTPGGVFYSLPGHPAFPVRLASEIYLDCAEWLAKLGRPGPYHLYDPCCGGAYHLAVLAYLHPGAFHKISASDVDADAISLAERNLSLITRAGLDQRRSQIEHMLEQFGKESHRAALTQAVELGKLIDRMDPPPEVRLFQADALVPDGLRRQFTGTPPDLVITDIPYGIHSFWIDDSSVSISNPPVWRMLESLNSVVSPVCVVAVAADKAQKIAHPGYRQIRKLKIGHRQVSILHRV